MMERTYRIEASVGQLVAERVRATGESEAQAAASLSADPAAVARVAVDGRVAAAELSSELQEFRLEVKEGLDNLDKKMQQMKLPLNLLSEILIAFFFFFIFVYFSAYTGGFNHKSMWTSLGSSPQ